MWADCVPAFLGARTCAISFKHAQYFGCTTCPSRLKFQLYSVGTQKSPHGLYIAAQDAVQILKGRGKQENQHPFTCLIFSLLFYILLAEISLFFVSFWLQPVICWKIEVFQLKFAFLPLACLQEPLHSSVYYYAYPLSFSCTQYL